MKMQKISVIVPVYNTEKYLSRCVDSLINQTYTDIEIILVDDGSKDSSPAICDRYAELDSRVKVIHQSNGGLSCARNTGLCNAKGDYIGFVDSDDWVESDTYYYLINLIKNSNAGAAQINYININRSDKKAIQPKEKISVYSEKNILQFFMTTTTTTGSYSVCRCLFSKQVLAAIRFRIGKLNEDIDYKYKVLSNCHNFVVSNQIKYYYFQSNESLSTGGLKKKDFDLYDAADELVRLTANEEYGNIAKLGKVKKARTAFSLLSKVAYFGVSDPSISKKDIIRELTSEHRKNLLLLLDSPIPFSRKVLSVLFAMNYNIAAFAVSIIKRI